MRLSRRFALVGAAATLVPLLAFGAVAIRAMQAGTRRAVSDGLVSLTGRTASQLDQWFSRTATQAGAIGADFEGTALTPWQQERALRNAVLVFPEFRELTLFGAGGRPAVSSHLSPGLAQVPRLDRQSATGVHYSRISVDDDLLPTLYIGVPVRGSEAGERWLVGTLNLEHVWRVVDDLRIGQQGYAMLVDEEGRLFAHGDPDRKGSIAQGEHLSAHPLAYLARADRTGAPVLREFADDRGVRQLAAAVRLSSIDWLLIVEQPTSEAFALAERLERLLLATIAVAIGVMIALGWWLGRSLIDPITTLVGAAGKVAAGDLDARVALGRDDEFHRLGDAFNRMTERLKALQEETRRQERQAMFGRIAAGLVHDLSHPVQNLANSCKLLLRRPDDLEYRETFRRAVDRETGTMKRVLDDLRQVGRPAPLERFPVDVTRHAADAVEGVRAAAEAAGVSVEFQSPGSPLVISGDAFALGRVWRNLLQNAVEATPAGGRITMSVTPRGGAVRVRVRDTGAGIAAERLPTLFDEFVTTKRRGLGLGLAICKRIVEQLDGTIAVESVVGRGTDVEVTLPLSHAG